MQYLFCVIICASLTAVKINKFWRIVQFAVLFFVVGNMKFNHSYNPLLSNVYLIEFVAIYSNLLRAEHMVIKALWLKSSIKIMVTEKVRKYSEAKKRQLKKLFIMFCILPFFYMYVLLFLCNIFNEIKSLSPKRREPLYKVLPSPFLT